jgi:BioD-like phosphotransacetylase family protein
MNAVTPRVFIAATRQNDGKTTISLGLLSALQRSYPRIGYIKPVGQRFVEIAEQKFDEDTVLMDSVYQLNCPLVDMSPIAVEPDFTRRYLEKANRDTLVNKIQAAFDRVAWERFRALRRFRACRRGRGLRSRTRKSRRFLTPRWSSFRGGIGKPIDEVVLNQALFEKEGVEIIGVIINKVIPEKIDYVADFARRGLKRKGLDLLGVIPHQNILSSPSVSSIQEELGAELLTGDKPLHNLVDDVVVGAMGVNNAMRFFRRGVLLITPGDREDIILAAAASGGPASSARLAGIVLTGALRPSESVMAVIRDLTFPVLLAREDSYEVASKVHDLIVKTRPDDTEKIALIRDLIAEHVDVGRILKAVRSIPLAKETDG